MFKNILVVCMGNICRSPAAEGLLRDSLGKQVNLSSAGIGALVDAAAEERIKTMLLEKGCDITSHRARQLTSEMLQKSDLILVMEQGHTEAITSIAPECRGKVKLLGHWIGKKEIPDPYKKSDHVVKLSLNLIYDSVESWLKYLK